jgi:hypothetical protein
MAVSIILVVATFAGCAEVVSTKPIDTDYTAAYDAMETVYEYKYDWYHGDFKMLPVYKSVHHAAVYRVQYEDVYSDGKVYHRWQEVDKAEYDRAVKAIAERKENE